MIYKNINDVIDAFDSVIGDESTPDNVKEWLHSLGSSLTVDLNPVDKFVKGTPLPSGIGALADEYADVRDRRLALDKEAKGVKDRETEIYKMIMAELAESSDTGAAGTHHRVQMVEKERFNVSDWTLFHGFVRDNNLFELLQKRLADKAVQELADTYDGNIPPGVEQVKVPTLSFSKVG